MKITITAILTLILPGIISAQYLSLPDDYQQNPYIINPSYIAKDRSGIIFISKRDYMTSLKGSPTNVDFGGAFPLLFNAGFGFKANMNKQGIFKATNAEVSYSYMTEFTEVQSIHFGISAGIIDYRLNSNDVVTGDMSDQVLTNTYYNKTKFTTGVGMYYNLFDLGVHVSMPRLLEYSHFNQTIFAMVTYNVHAIINNKSTILGFQPAISFLHVPLSPNQLDFNLITSYKKTVLLQTSYRTNKSYIVGLSMCFADFTIGYTHEFNTDNVYYIAKNSHEIGLKYSLDPEGLKKSWNKTIRRFMQQH